MIEIKKQLILVDPLPGTSIEQAVDACLKMIEPEKVICLKFNSIFIGIFNKANRDFYINYYSYQISLDAIKSAFNLWG